MSDKERKHAIVRSAEESVRKNRTEKTVHDLIYAIGLTDSIKKEFPMSFKILEKLFTEKYQPDETQPDKIIGITDFAIRRRPISMHFDSPKRGRGGGFVCGRHGAGLDWSEEKRQF